METPAVRLSFRWQITLLGALVVVLFLAVLVAALSALRYTTSAVSMMRRRAFRQRLANWSANIGEERSRGKRVRTNPFGESLRSGSSQRIADAFGAYRPAENRCGRGVDSTQARRTTLPLLHFRAAKGTNRR